MGIKRIAVLTSGGDAPGMNAVIRSVVRTAVSKNLEVIGIRRGYNGLINVGMKLKENGSYDFTTDPDKNVIPMDVRSVSDIIHRGGTILYTARSTRFKEKEGVMLAVDACKYLGIEGIVVIGGDGSFRGARDLSHSGIPCVGIPGTIDNDISCSEYTIGFDTAMNTAMEMVDKLRDTTQAHDRCSVVEVMGKDAGYLALRTGIAVGAISVLVPEIPFDIDEDIIPRMQAAKRNGKEHFIIVVAEGVQQNVASIANEIALKMDIGTRSTVLGHVQRGGSPTSRDRIVASRMGYHAVELLAEGIGDRVVVIQSGEVLDYDITEALEMKKPFEYDLYKIAHEISM